MLTQDDINWMKSNRSEVIANRTESITLVKMVNGAPDPYTGEPTESAPQLIAVDAIWKEYSTISNGDITVIDGVELRQDDVKVTFDSSVYLANAEKVIRGGVDFNIIAIDEKGIGGTNRYECLARRVV